MLYRLRVCHNLKVAIEVQVGELFGEALNKATRRGQERLRRPAELPVESDLQDSLSMGYLL